MIPEASILLMFSLLGSALADQFSEVYNKDDSFLKFRNPSDFQPPPPEYRYVPIEGLPSHQHGFTITNTQAVQGTQKLTDSQRETIRKQEEFWKSAFDTSNVRGHEPVSNVQQSTVSPSTPAFRTLADPGADFTPHPTFNLRLQGEPKVTPSTLHTIDFNSFQTEPAIVRQGSGSVIQHVPPQKTSSVQPERRPTFAFREQSTTPSYQQEVNAFGQDFLRTNVRQQPQQQQQQQQEQFQRQPFQQQQLQQQQPSHGTFNVNKRPVPSSDNQQRFSGFRISGDEIVGSELDTQLKIPITEAPAFSSFPSVDEEEAKFISQVNQNTAAGASQINGFHQTQFNKFNELPARVASTRRPVSQNLPQDDTFEAGKRRKLVTQRTRKPVVPINDQSQFGLVSNPVAPLSDVQRQRTSTRLQDENLRQSEEPFDELEARKQAESAQYNFASSVSDTVNGNSQSRQEVRDGLKLSGMYSYSDGFFRRTVFYEADENGYRIVKEESEPIGKGPQYDPNGEVQVNYQHDGSKLNYKIRGDQFKKRPVAGKETSVVRSGAVDYNDQLELPV